MIQICRVAIIVVGGGGGDCVGNVGQQQHAVCCRGCVASVACLSNVHDHDWLIGGIRVGLHSPLFSGSFIFESLPLTSHVLKNE